MPVKFLLRASVLLVAMLVMWWLVLVNPLLFVLRASAALPFAFLTGSSASIAAGAAQWDFRIPIGLQAISFSIPRSDVVVFTFSLPVYWAIALASRTRVRSLLIGTLIMEAIEVLSLIAFAALIGHSVAAQRALSYSSFARWFTEFANYLLVDVIPFLAPVLLAVVLDRDLRSRMFSQKA